MPLSLSRAWLYVCSLYVSELLCVGSDFTTGRSTLQGTRNVAYKKNLDAQ
jgi:hypothetical protein